jgi:hypothetical protein
LSKHTKTPNTTTPLLRLLRQKYIYISAEGGKMVAKRSGDRAEKEKCIF